MIYEIENKVTRKTAIKFDGNFEEIEEFVGGDAEFRNGQLLIATLEGVLQASKGDYIIKGLEGEFYPCKSDIFHKSYHIVKLNRREK